jgi:hypothetical protein
MKITPELVAKLIFASSQLRYFEQQLLIDPNQEMHDIVIRWQCKVDEVLCLMDADQFMSLKTILETINLNETTNA